MDARFFKCDLCQRPFPNWVQGANPTVEELYAAHWIPLGGKIFCEVCAVRALALAVELITSRPGPDNP
jgi:hypothetical protein